MHYSQVAKSRISQNEYNTYIHLIEKWKRKIAKQHYSMHDIWSPVHIGVFKITYKIYTLFKQNQGKK